MSVYGYVFGLSEDVLECVNQLGGQKQLTVSFEDLALNPDVSIKQSAEGGQATCLTCGSLTFESAEEQRQHYHSDWHKYNVKRKVQNQKFVDENTFERMIEEEQEVGSLSGSDDEEISNHLDENASLAIQGIYGPQIVFQSLQDEIQFSVWSTILSKERQSQSHLKQLKSLVEEVRNQKNEVLWGVIMLSGGHFAAAVYHMQPYIESQTSKRRTLKQRKSLQQNPKLFPVVAVVHKTYHRYVVRAKAGGKQSSKDSQGKTIHSAGASLRRYNEAALQRDIGQTLKSWRKEYLDKCSLIFVSASQNDAGNIFNAETGLQDIDERVRKIPFSTRRPTCEETGRVVRTLATAWSVQTQQENQTTLDENFEGQIQTEASLDIENSKEGSSVTVQQRINNDDKNGNVVDNDDDEAVSEELQNESQDILSQQLYETPLHTASRNGDLDRINELLEQGEDITLIDGNGRTPYHVALNKQTRDVFRRFMALYPNMWDYQQAGVPGPLTEEMEQSQVAKKAEKRARQKAKQAELKKLQKSQKEELEKVEQENKMTAEEEIQAALLEASRMAKRGQNCGGASSSKTRVDKNKVSKGGGKSSSSKQVDLQTRREVMAKAAEERMKNLQNLAHSQKLY